MDGINLTQSLKTEQTLSPQMLQSLALLPMPILELKAHIQAEIESNPALEIPDSEYDLSQFEPEKEKTLDDRMEDADSADYEDMSYYDPEASDRKQMLIENSSAPGETLKEHLMVQLGEAEPVGILNDQGVDIRNVDPRFDDRCAYEYLHFSTHYPLHHVGEHLPVHSPVSDCHRGDTDTDTAVAAIGIFFITTLCNSMTFRSMPSVTVFASPSISVTVACAAIKSPCLCPSRNTIAEVINASEAPGST